MNGLMLSPYMMIYQSSHRLREPSIAILET